MTFTRCYYLDYVFLKFCTVDTLEIEDIGPQFLLLSPFLSIHLGKTFLN